MEVFSDSVNSASGVYFSQPPSTPLAVESLPPDIEALRRLSTNLSSLFLSQSPNFSDFTLVVQSRSLALHRGVLSARSPFFYRLFAERNDGSSSKLELGEVLSGFEVGYEALVLVLGYVYSGKVGPLPLEVCECADAECGHVACWPAVDFMLQVLFASATFEISELVSLFQRHLLGILEKVDVDDIPVILSVANLCGTACGRLLTECIRMVVDSELDIAALEKALPEDIFKQIMDIRTYLGLNRTEGTAFPDIHATRIHKALDSDDIELVKLLLEEGPATLDDAYALHYAVAYCNSKITAELLGLKLADVNLKNFRGCSVLHVAAKRREPEIIMCLLDNGARPYDLTSDGRKAIQISKRLTKAVDYYRPTDQGKDTPKDRLCIEILDQAERRPPLGEASNSVAMAASELLQKLLYLEIRGDLLPYTRNCTVYKLCNSNCSVSSRLS